MCVRDQGRGGKEGEGGREGRRGLKEGEGGREGGREGGSKLTNQGLLNASSAS